MNNVPTDFDVVKALESLLAEVQHLEQDYPEDYNFKPYRDVLANARLITAAPELLEALVAAEQILSDCDDRDELVDEEIGTLKSIRSAISKAKGTL